MTEKRFKYYRNNDGTSMIYDREQQEYYFCVDFDNICNILNNLHEENMNNRAEITRFKLIVSDIVDDLEKQAKNGEAIVISMDYVDWIKSELDLKLNGLKKVIWND